MNRMLIPLVDKHRERRMIELIIGVWILSFADLMLTLWAHLFTDFNELNPIAAAMLDADQLASLVLYKVMLTACGTAILWRLRRYMQAEMAMWLVLASYIFVTLQWSDYTIRAIAASTELAPMVVITTTAAA